jgi:hypothetical protein
MQFAFQHTAEIETHTFQTAEIELAITYQYTPPSRGSRGTDGEPEEPDEEAEIEILSIVDANGKEYEPEEIENIHSHCWDHFENNEE